MTFFQRIVVILTGLVFLVGSILLLSGRLFPSRTDSFATHTAYEHAREAGEISMNAPPLPACAKSIEISYADGALSALEFSCAPDDVREFLTDLRHSFEWNILMRDQGRIRLERVANHIQ